MKIFFTNSGEGDVVRVRFLPHMRRYTTSDLSDRDYTPDAFVTVPGVATSLGPLEKLRPQLRLFLPVTWTKQSIEVVIVNLFGPQVRPIALFVAHRRVTASTE